MCKDRERETGECVWKDGQEIETDKETKRQRNNEREGQGSVCVDYCVFFELKRLSIS